MYCIRPAYCRCMIWWWYIDPLLGISAILAATWRTDSHQCFPKKLSPGWSVVDLRDWKSALKTGDVVFNTQTHPEVTVKKNDATGGLMGNVGCVFRVCQ